MLQQILMALGAGAASAVLFVVPAKGTFGSLAFGVLAPLPLLIIGLGLGEAYLAGAAALGALAIGGVLGPSAGLAFLVSAVAPALVIGFLGRRPRFCQPGHVLAAICACAVGAAWLGVAAVAFRYASLEAALDDLSRALLPFAQHMLELTEFSAGLDALEFTRWIVIAMTPMAAAWGVAALCLNTWLAGRVAAISGLLPGGWPDIPSTLRLPRLAFVAVGLALAACLAPGVTRLLAVTALAGLVVAFAVQGLAALHAITRGRAGRAAILTGFYVLSLALFPWPLVLAAGLGLTDVARPFQRARAVPLSPGKRK